MDEIIEKVKSYLNEKFDSENTITSYISDIKQFITFYMENYDELPTNFTHVNLKSYKNYMQNKLKYRFTTINRKVAALYNFDNFLIKHNYKIEDKRAVFDDDYYDIAKKFITSDMIPEKTINKIRSKASKESIRDYAMITCYDERWF